MSMDRVSAGVQYVPMSNDMAETACFVEEDGGYWPLDLAKSYWNDAGLGGRAVVGLLGYEIERLHGATGVLMPARLTVDMFRLAPFDRVQIEARVIKEGRRLRLVEAQLIAGGEPVARASCQFLGPMEAPPGRVWAPGPWRSPGPESLTQDEERAGPRAFDLRWVSGGLGEVTEKQCWTRERFALVRGRPISPFARVAIAADFASPYTNIGDAGVRYMNTDVNIHLHRLPQGEWIGFEATGHEASQGIAVGHCRLHDVGGAIGFVSCTALANRRRKPG